MSQFVRNCKPRQGSTVGHGKIRKSRQTFPYGYAAPLACPTPLAYHLFNRWPLKYVLIVPFCALVLALAVIIGASSFLTGRAAVDDLDNQLLADMANRVEQAVSGHLQDGVTLAI